MTRSTSAHPDRAAPAGGPVFDGVSIALSCWVIVGLFLDGWAHEHQPRLESFLTPWHAVLYSGALAQLALLGAALGRSRAHGRSWQRALPSGYDLSLAGAVVFLLAGLADFGWHTAFGIEANLEALLSPPHLALAAGLALMLGGPLRAAWQRPDPLSGWSAQLPMLLSLALLLALLGFFTGYGHPFTGTGLVAGPAPREAELVYSYQARGILGILLQSGLLMGALLPIVLRHGATLPMGALTLVLGLNGLLLSALGGRYAPLLAALLAGAVADLLLRWLRPFTTRAAVLHLFAFAVPATLYGAYFAALELWVGHVWWPVHLWAGAVVLAGVTGLLLSSITLPSRVAKRVVL